MLKRREFKQVQGGGKKANLQVVLQEDLLAAVDSCRDPSKALATVLKRKPNGDLKKSCRRIQVVNRFMNISIDKDRFVKVEWIDGEWQPYAADCPGEDGSYSSDECPST